MQCSSIPLLPHDLHPVADCFSFSHYQHAVRNRETRQKQSEDIPRGKYPLLHNTNCLNPVLEEVEAELVFCGQ